MVAVKEAADEAVAHCRAGKGPILLEMLTYRYRGHSMSDPARYRSREEVQEMREHHDAIDLVRRRLAEAGVSEDELKKIEDEARAEVTAAAEFAQSSPEPDPSELWTDVLLEG